MQEENTISDQAQDNSNDNAVDQNANSEAQAPQTTHENNELSTDQSDNQEANANNDQPDWFLKDKYKTIDDQAKAYTELSKKIGKYWGAPKDDYSLEGIEGVDKDDPLLTNLAPALKEIGLSQDGFKSLVGHYQQAQTKMVEKFEAALKEELTTKDAHTYQAVSKWMDDNLKPEEIEQVKNNWLMTPADFKVFNALRLMAAPSTSVPNSLEGASARYESSTQVENDKIKYRKEVKEGIRTKDKNYENDLAARYRDAVAREMRSRG